MKQNLPNLSLLKEKIETADAILIGAGAGLSTASGIRYSGDRFLKYFSDFAEKYNIPDMYTGGFTFFPTPKEENSPFSLEEQWGWWCRQIYYNRHLPEAGTPYTQLFDLVKDKNYFVLTTNADHQFPKANFPKDRLFYCQGDYGLLQCYTPCKQETFPNQHIIEEMIQNQTSRTIPTNLIPHCPHCNNILTLNLRKDDTFVESEGWHNAQHRYQSFLKNSEKKSTLFLELGVGYNTPSIIKYPFWQMTYQRKNAFFVSINDTQPEIPKELKKKSLFLTGDLAEIINHLHTL